MGFFDIIEELDEIDKIQPTAAGAAIGALIGALSGYFWYASVPALAIYCVFCIDRVA
jgi:hypothetical protein